MKCKVQKTVLFHVCCVHEVFLARPTFFPLKITLKKDFFSLKKVFFIVIFNGKQIPLRNKNNTFLHSGTSPSCKKMLFLCLLAPSKVRAKKSYLYFCQEIIFFHSKKVFFNMIFNGKKECKKSCFIFVVKMKFSYLTFFLPTQVEES